MDCVGPSSPGAGELAAVGALVDELVGWKPFMLVDRSSIRRLDFRKLGCGAGCILDISDSFSNSCK